uniref:Uncharacterized protein n=1 Tax=Parastrongyloides trichosuri TaxID=131310 RepID=A0A0N5A508_PARTI
MDIETFNKITWKRFEKRDEYLRLMKNVETIMDNYRFNLAKIRVTTGYNTAIENQKNIENLELEPALYCSVNDDTIFSLISKEDIDKNQNKDDTESKSSNKYLYKPFGVFENIYVKNARKSIDQVIPILCDLASLRGELLALDEEYFAARDTLEFC